MTEEIALSEADRGLGERDPLVLGLDALSDQLAAGLAK